MLPIFPTLPVGFSIHKRPTYATIPQTSTSGLEVRQAQQKFPLWEFELLYEQLKDQTQNQVPWHDTAGFTQLQQLSALYLCCNGQFGRFYYEDSTDLSRTKQLLGTGSSAVIWSTNTVAAPGVVGALVVLAPGDFIAPGSSTFSPNGNFFLAFQNDGNVVLYQYPAIPLWATNTVGSGATELIMQLDGNLVLLNGSTPVWASFTNDHAGAYLQIQNDGNLVIIEPVKNYLFVRTLGTSVPFGTEIVGGVNLGHAIHVYLDNVELVESGNWGIGTDLISLEFTTPPGIGVVITASFYFYYKCRFLDDTLAMEQFYKNRWAFKSVKFRSVLDTDPNQVLGYGPVPPV